MANGNGNASKQQVAYTETDPDTAIAAVLALIEKGDVDDAGNPKLYSLPELMIQENILNPFMQAVVIKGLRDRLKEGGSHFHLSEQRKWLRGGEKWAAELGLEKAKGVVKFDRKVGSVEEVRARITEKALSPAAKATANIALNTLNDRSGRKLDQQATEKLTDCVEKLSSEVGNVQEKLIAITAERDDAKKEKKDLMEIVKIMAQNSGMGAAGLAVAAE